MQYVPSSLRAERGNPEANATHTGLLRRPKKSWAPRNDGSLRAFASSRETDFLFSSREPKATAGQRAKTRRKAAWLILVGVLALTPGPLFACGQLSHALQRRAQTAFERDLAATRVVRGIYKRDTVTEAGERELERGGIYSRKGKLRYKVWTSAATISCSLYAYPSDGDKGIFYLRRIGKGDFNVVHYETD